ncbi:TUB4 [Candida oxycetoniae]|uniref:Tubulin gamma chain n=1 Tax=Candida oxycetoniae TaxID=497107 RepID=A0AAI9WZS5_9ASCO|nr:TUB4 [Candida oxycetoniae]KAI3406682.2 TUB4 [Candida oxycetoniae]
MPGETITIQAGQCGNQVGLSYWQQLANEHGLNSDGVPTPYPSTKRYEFIDYNQQDTTTGVESARQQQVQRTMYREDNPELYFTISDAHTYTPRSISIDLEPSVIAKSLSSMSMFNPRNVHLSEQGNGAANNWANGYRYGQEHIEEIVNLIDREVDKCDNLSQFQLIHSVAGGTGAGVGSKILEVLQDRYTNKKLITTVSVFPSNDKTSDVVVQPYNTVLTLQRLIECSDATFVFHNDALNNIENLISNQNASFSRQELSNGGVIGIGKGKRGGALFQGANKLIASVMASISNPIRFPGYMYSSIESIMSSMVPTPDLKFLTSSIAPFNNFSNHKYINEYDMFLELSDDRYKSVIIPSTSGSDVSYISLMNYLISPTNLDRKEIRKGILKIQSRTNFPPWASRSIAVVHGHKSPFLKDQSLEGIQLSNNTSIIEVFEKILRQYDMLAKRKAYWNTYCEENSPEELDKITGIFSESKEAVVSVINEYKACKSMNYLEDDDDDDDVGDVVNADVDVNVDMDMN